MEKTCDLDVKSVDRGDKGSQREEGNHSSELTNSGDQDVLTGHDRGTQASATGLDNSHIADVSVDVDVTQLSEEGIVGNHCLSAQATSNTVNTNSEAEGSVRNLELVLESYTSDNQQTQDKCDLNNSDELLKVGTTSGAQDLCSREDNSAGSESDKSLEKEIESLLNNLLSISANNVSATSADEEADFAAHLKLERPTSSPEHLLQDNCQSKDTGIDNGNTV